MTRDVLRLSQVVGLFGPGAMVDLPERSIVVGGLDDWDHRRPGSFKSIEEPRLARLLQLRLRNDPRWASDSAPEFRTPPIDSRNPRSQPPTITSAVFPRWFVCESLKGDQPGRRRLVPFSDLQPPKRQDFVGDDGKRRAASPVRFVAGCTKGHLQDIDWRWLLHSGGGACRQPMWLVETSTSADPRDTRIECECGAGLTLEELFLPGRLGACHGERPWIGDRDPVP